jgi:sulfur-oxidizing protein SoxX
MFRRPSGSFQPRLSWHGRFLSREQIPAYAARTFTLPDGAAAGREVFTTIQCYTYYTVAGETFPAYPPRTVGPDLTGMGAHHPAAYFAESFINPNAVIVTGAGYTGPDGRSRMPASNDDLTVTQLLDLVAYLTSLRTPSSSAQPGSRHMHRSSHRKRASYANS